MKIPLPNGSEGTAILPRTRSALINCWNAQDRIIGRPGITSLATTTGVSRGQFRWNDSVYQVVSTNLIKITNQDTGAFTTIGTIAGTAAIDSDIGFNHAVIIVKGGNGYTLDAADTLTQITDVSFEASDSVTHINGRFVYIPSNGDPAFFSDVGDGSSIQPESFFDAEELPDKNRVNFNFNNTLHVGGTNSFELYRDTGATPVPYTRLQGGRIQNGYISGILEYNRTFLFVGREKDQDLGIYAIAQGAANKISNEYIDTILATYTEAQLEEVISSRFKWHGYDIATFAFANHAFGFFGGNWFDLTTMSNGDHVPWQAGYITFNDGKYITSFSDKIGYLADINTDYGSNFEKLIDFGYEFDGDLVIDNLTLGLTQGYNTNPGSVALSMSHDNVLYSSPFYRETGLQGEYSDSLEWRYPGGLGYYRNFVGVRLSTTENIKFAVSTISMNE